MSEFKCPDCGAKLTTFVGHTPRLCDVMRVWRGRKPRLPPAFRSTKGRGWVLIGEPANGFRSCFR